MRPRHFTADSLLTLPSGSRSRIDPSSMKPWLNTAVIGHVLIAAVVGQLGPVEPSAQCGRGDRPDVGVPRCVSKNWATRVYTARDSDSSGL